MLRVGIPGVGVGKSGGSWPPVTTTAVEFDGLVDYQTRGADPTGAADGLQFFYSDWIQFDASRDGAVNVLLANGSSSANSGVYVAKAANNSINVLGRNAAGQARNTNIGGGLPTLTSASGWNLLMLSYHYGLGRFQAYLNNTALTPTAALANTGNLDMTTGNFSLGALTTGTNKFAGCRCWTTYDDTAPDISSTSFRRKFITAAGLPVDQTISLPFGATGPLFLSANGDMTVNLGRGGNMTTTGALTDCPDSPNPA